MDPVSIALIVIIVVFMIITAFSSCHEFRESDSEFINIRDLKNRERLNSIE